MYIKFHSIRLLRFRSFLNETILHFDSIGPGLYFLRGRNEFEPKLGSNGSGKSSILDALLWCLYGKTVQGLKNLDIAPWTGKGKTEVELTVFIDKQQHTIKRTANPNLLTIDNREVGQDSIFKLIPIPLDVVPYTIILGQRQLLFFDLLASEKLKVFASSLNLERWDARAAHASEVVRNLETEIAVRETELVSFEQRLESVKIDFLKQKERADHWDAERADFLTNKEKEKHSLEKKLAPLLSARDNADLTLDRAETELRALNLNTLTQELFAANLKFEKAKQEELTTGRRQQELAEMLEQADKQVCPTCSQPLKGKHLHELRSAFERQIEELDIAKVNSKVAAYQAERDKLQISVANNEKAARQFQQDADNSRDALLQTNKAIAGVQAEISVIDNLYQEYANQDNPYREQLTVLRRRKATTEQEIDKAKEALAAKKEYCESVRFWIKGFKDIKLYTLEEILQELEITTNAMLEQFGLINWKIEYDVERETKSKTIARGLNISVFSPNNSKPVKWECWSGGEGQRLRLIGTLALGSVLLNHLGVATNLSVFDEPTESLSQEGIVDLVDLLAQRAADAKMACWLIDHHTVESSRFKDVITVVKDNKGSRISAK